MNARTCANSVGWAEGKRWKMTRENHRWAGATVDARTCVDSARTRERWKWVRRRTGGHERAWMRKRAQTVQALRIKDMGWASDVCSATQRKGGNG